MVVLGLWSITTRLRGRSLRTGMVTVNHKSKTNVLCLQPDWLKPSDYKMQKFREASPPSLIPGSLLKNGERVSTRGASPQPCSKAISLKTEGKGDEPWDEATPSPQVKFCGVVCDLAMPLTRCHVLCIIKYVMTKCQA